MKTSNILPLLFLSVLMNGCGGGGSDTSTSKSPPPENTAPTANAGTDQSVNEEAVITLSGNGSDSDGSISSYQWLQTAGTTVSVVDTTNASITFTAPTLIKTTTLIFELTVTDDDGSTGKDTIEIVINPVNLDPTANAGSDQSADEKTPVILSGSGSDSDGSIASYTWLQTSGDSVTLSDSSSASTTFTAPSVDSDTTYKFQLSVADNEGSIANDEVSVSIINVPKLQDVRAIHIGGNWQIEGTFENPPAEWFDYLRSINVNWIGFSVMLNVDDSLDSSVEKLYEHQYVTTFSDTEILNFSAKCKEEGFNVYMTLALELNETAEKADKQVLRHWLGDPVVGRYGDDISPDNWPWSPIHLDHNQFIADFWTSYTKEAVHFAKLANQADIGMYSLGTETFALFRTRPDVVGWDMHSDFKNEIRNLVSEVKKEYDGLVTYDQAYDRSYDEFSIWNNLWEDGGFDVIGISAYYSMLKEEPVGVASVEVLKERWREIFKNHLVHKKEMNQDKPIVFLEFGYTNHILSSFHEGESAGQPVMFSDVNNNGLDDGEEVQANIYKAFFDVNKEFDYLVSGTFLWGNGIGTQEQYQTWDKPTVNFGVREHLAEDVVKSAYKNIQDNSYN